MLNGTTTIFCDSHEIGNVMDVAGVEAMLEDAREAPLSIFLTLPSTVPATSAALETAGGDLTPDKIAGLFDRWPEAVGLGEKMDFVPVTMGDERSHAILAAALKRGRPVSGHVYGREFVAAYAASGVTDTHEAIDRDIADDLLDAGSGSSCAGDRRPHRGTRCRRRSALSPSSALRTSARPRAPTIATPMISCCSVSTGWCGRR
ncbi:adenine deaminase [Bradyrhizobium sp. F1.13.1]